MMKSEYLPPFSQILLEFVEAARSLPPLAERDPVSLYFAHALTGVEEPYLDHAKSIKEKLLSMDDRYVIDDFYGLGPAASPRRIVEIDFKKAIQCDLMVCLHLLPSYGAGGEFHLRSFLGLPTIFLHPLKKKVTRMMSGGDHWGPHVKVVEYFGIENAAVQIHQLVQSTDVGNIPTSSNGSRGNG